MIGYGVKPYMIYLSQVISLCCEMEWITVNGQSPNDFG
jgi:hypothetical protein